MTNYDYEWFKKSIQILTGIDLNSYKEKQMKRRIDTLIIRRKKSGYQDFMELLFNSQSEMNYFLDYITINVSEFFRTEKHWTYFEKEVIPNLKKLDTIRIWSTACSTGEEPYSLAMSLFDHIDHARIQIIATDVNERVLEAARKGIFNKKSMETVPEYFKNKYFTVVDDRYIIDQSIRKCIEFKKLNLLEDEFPKQCDLIVCRNVLIYFTEQAKSTLFTKFHNCLNENGCLFLGNAEQIVYYKDFGFDKKSSSFYIKKG